MGGMAPIRVLVPMSRLWLPVLDVLIGLLLRLVPHAKRQVGVLVSCGGGLGDALLFAVVLDRFRSLAEDGEPVDVLVRTDTKAATFAYPAGVGVIAVDYRRFLRSPSYRLRTCLGLRRRGYRLAVSADHLRHPLIDDVLIRVTGAPARKAMTPRSWSKYDRLLTRARRGYTHLKPVPPVLAHRLVRWVELANWLTGREDPVPVVELPAGALPARATLERDTVVLHPFSAIPQRQYGVDTFQRILSSLPADMTVVLSAGPGDLARNPEFEALLEDSRVRLDESDLVEKAALLGGARLVVSVDTSLMHLAVLAGAPTLCLGSAAHLVDSLPYDARMIPGNVTFLYHHMPCAGCLGACRWALEDGRYPCIARVDDALVVDRVTAMLAPGAAPNEPRSPPTR